MGSESDAATDRVAPASFGIDEPGKVKKYGSRVSCGQSTAILLCLLALIAVAASALITYYVTKGNVSEVVTPTLPNHPHIPPVNQTDVAPLPPVASGPSAAELRLPTSLKPEHYSLSVTVHLPGYVALEPMKDFTFDGHVNITMRVVSATDKIVLSAHRLTFPDVDQFELTSNGSDVNILSLSYNETLQMATLELSTTLTEDDTVVLSIPYSGLISETLAGFYRAHFIDDAGVTKVVAVTQFEPSDARKFVPCFDEPAMKAAWSVSVTHPDGTIALGNGIETGPPEKLASGWQTTRFKETPPMSTYLLAVFVGEFEYKESQTAKGTRVRVYSRPNAVAQIDYSLDVLVAGLNFFEDFYHVPFPLEKMDMLGVQDYAAGAMENWGLITFTETCLLFDPHTTTLSQKNYITQVIMHELAHQWFGNLVTMEWWSELWLNEGFAELMGYIGQEAFSDKWHTNDAFVLSSMNTALDVDSKASSRPIILQITKAEEVQEAFDTITYKKGGSFIRMLKAVLGDAAFHVGLTDYLQKHTHGNTVADDLWAKLNEHVNREQVSQNGKPFDVKTFADKWTLQMGYPVLTVEWSSGEARIRQSRFKRDELTQERDIYRNPPFGYKWDVPIFHSINGVDKGIAWLMADDADFRLSFSPDDLVILNADSLGFYRVDYGEEGWARIGRQLEEDHTKLSVASRARLLDDAFALAAAGTIPYETPLSLVSYLERETDYVAWAAGMSGVNSIRAAFGNDADSKHIRDFVLKRLRPLYEKIDWSRFATDDESVYMPHRLRLDVVANMCGLGFADCSAHLSSLFRTVYDNCRNDTRPLSKCTTVPPSLRAMVYCNGVETGGDEQVQFVLDKYSIETEHFELERLRTAVACSRDTYTLNTIMTRAADMSDTQFRLRDRSDVIKNIASTDVGSLLIHDFFAQNFEALEANSESFGIFNEIVSALPVRNEQRLKMYERFLEDHPKYSTVAAFGKLLERGRSAIEWSDKNRDHLSEYFANQSTATAA